MAGSRQNKSNGRRSRRTGSAARAEATNGVSFGGGGFLGDGDGVETTGRWLVTFREDAAETAVAELSDTSGFRVVNALDLEGEQEAAEAASEDSAVVFEEIGAAVVNAPPDRFGAFSLMAAESDAILAIEPERIVYAIERLTPERQVDAVLTPEADFFPTLAGDETMTALPVDYLRGYRDGVVHLIDRLLASEGAAFADGDLFAPALRESAVTWGLQATRVDRSRFSGMGVRVAVLDTGLDMQHPDFAGRRIIARSFVQGETAQDGHGHGTHCIGTACGPQRPGQLPRYGIAYGADIYAGKVLSNAGSGTDGGILAGINWAIANRCAVASMSLGTPVCFGPSQPFSQVFEQVAQRALARGTLIVAAAGNESSRPGSICAVSHPANCPSILAVGAIDPRGRVASFSNGGLNPQGGQVDLAAPGVAVRSSWPQPRLYRTIDGTSMATPHVAGIAALFAEANPGMAGRDLVSLLFQHARRMMLPARDVGAGLVQAP